MKRYRVYEAEAELPYGLLEPGAAALKDADPRLMKDLGDDRDMALAILKGARTVVWNVQTPAGRMARVSEWFVSEEEDDGSQFDILNWSREAESNEEN